MKRPRKVLIAIIGGMVCLGIFLAIVLPLFVKLKLDRAIERTLDGYYNLTYEENHTSLGMSGFNIRFEGVKLSSDITKTGFISRFPVVYFKAKLFEVKHIKISDLLFSSELDINSVLIEEPNLTFVVPKQQKETIENENREEKGITKIEIPIAPKRSLKMLSLKDFEINEGEVSLVFMSKPSDTIRVGENIEVKLESLEVDLKKNSNIFEASTSKQLYFSLDNLFFTPEEGGMSYRLDKLYFDYEKGELQATNLDISPKTKWEELNAKAQYQATFKKVSLDTFRCKSNNFQTLEGLKLFEAQSLEFINLHANMYRDKTKPVDKRKNKRVLQRVLLDLPIRFLIDSVIISNGNIEYSMYDNTQSKIPGEVYLDSIYGGWFNINTTDTSETSSRLALEGNFMKHGQFQFNADIPIKAHARHSFDFSLTGLPLANLNPLLRLSNMEISRGHMDYVRYEGNNTDSTSTGSVTALYRDFKMTITDRNKEKMWLKSGLANLILRKKNKEDQNGQPLTYNFHYQRPRYRGHTDLLTGALIDGIARSMLPEVLYSNISF